ncbi:MAG TPA: SLBB domain-containing protein [Capsulimonadaceae bacterium]
MNNTSVHRRIVLAVASLAGASALLAIPVATLAQKAATPPKTETDAPAQPPTKPAADDPTYVPQPPNTLNPAVPKPSNPLVMDDLNTKTGNSAAMYDNTGRKALSVVPDTSGAINPEAGTRFGDPAQRFSAKQSEQLPLFGYDFFSSTRQIIEARRRSFQSQYGVTSSSTSAQPQRGSSMSNPGPGEITANDNSQPLKPLNPAYPGPVNNPYALNTPATTATPETLNNGTWANTGQYVGAPSSYSTVAPGSETPSTATSTGTQAGSLAQQNATGVNAAGTQQAAGAAVASQTQITSPSQAQGATTNSSQSVASSAPATQAQVAPRQSNSQVLSTEVVPSLDPYAGQIVPAGKVGQGTMPTGPKGTSTVQSTRPTDTSSSIPASMSGADSSIDAFHGIADPLSQLFRNVQQSLPPDYQLNPGDTITLRMWSPTIPMREFKSTIDSRGIVYLTDIGPQVIRGLSAAQAENQLRTKLRRMYRDMDVSISLSELRTMTVTVSGAAFSPGSYTVPAGTTAFNLLYAAGGPTLEGSLRAIEVRRKGAIAGTVDLYSFILGGADAADMQLRPGDIVYIPQRLARVSVHGEVRHPAIFEAKDSDTLADVIRFAGGVKPSGVTQRIQLNTFQPGQARILKDINLSDQTAQKATALYDGEDIDVFSIRTQIVNRVTIDGAVDQPGDYALTTGMRLSDLINRARGPIEDAYTVRADLYRWNQDNTLTLVPVDVDKALAHDPANDVALSRWDRLHLYTMQEVRWTGRREVTIRGAVQRPGTYYRSDNMHAKDVLLQAGGTLPDAYLNRAVLLHQRPDGSFTYDYISVAEALKVGGDPGPALQDNDILAIYKVGEAQFTRDHLVTIRGRVVSPGIYPRGDKMRLSNLMQLAGGFIPGAGFTVQVTHIPRVIGPVASQQVTQTISLDAQHNFGDNQDVLLEDGDVVTVQGIGGLYDNVRIVNITGAVNRPGPIPITKNMRLSDAISAAGGIRPEAYPKGAEFVRNPSYLTTPTQQSLAVMIKRLNELLNASDYHRQQAKSDVERMLAIQDAASSGSVSALAGASSAGAAATAVGASSNLANRELVTPARVLSNAELVPNGNVAINLSEAIDKPGSRADFLLMDGDSISVPEMPTTVQVVGAVFNSRGVLFKPGASIDYYISQAGGYAPDAAKKRIEVIRAGGGLIEAGKVGRLEAGDVILVPTEVMAANIRSNRNSFNDIFSQIANSVIIFKVFTNLIK